MQKSNKRREQEKNDCNLQKASNYIDSQREGKDGAGNWQVSVFQSSDFGCEKDIYSSGS